MTDRHDIIIRSLLGEELDASAREQVRELLAEDPALRRAVGRWYAMEEALESALETTLPERRLLVLQVMAESGIELRRSEREALEAAGHLLKAARMRLVALPFIEERIADDIEAFEACWHEREELKRRDRSGQTHSAIGVDRPARPRAASARWAWRIPVAAVVAFFVVLVVLLARRDAAFEHVVTGAGETRLIEFADGTSIHLRENSRLSYIPWDRQGVLNRRARLDGRAFFQVSPQQAGLVVETSAADVTVVGTTFALVAEDDATDVYLVEGRLMFAPEGAPREAVTLAPGQHSRVARGERPSGPHNVDLADALTWTGFFVFRSTPLSEIASRIGSHYDRQVRVAPHLQQEQVTGTFDASLSIEAILETIAAAVNARVRPQPDGAFVLD